MRPPASCSRARPACASAPTAPRRPPASRSRAAASRSCQARSWTWRRPRAGARRRGRGWLPRSSARSASWPTRASSPRRPSRSSPPSARSSIACAGSWRRCERRAPSCARRRRCERRAPSCARGGVVRDERPLTPQQAERRVLERELFGMRFGLDRMRRMLTALEHPERRFASIHVVGTNGKSSTTRMIAAILRAHGLRTAAYLSPHLLSYCERISIDGRDLSPERFAAAIARASHAAELVDRSIGPEDRVTQFELLTAAAYDEIAHRQVEVAVIEAGLGGRYDATNVIDSRVQVLTGVGLEHTRWLGPTITAIAGEKLDVVRPGGTLVLGAGMHPEAMAVAERVAGERGARIVRAGCEPGVPVGAPGAYQRRNFALA